MAKRLATTTMAVVVFLMAVLGVAHATDTSSPTVRLDCAHGVEGCAGMNGDFATDSGAPITSFAVYVEDLTTGAVIDVTTTGCRLTTRPENPETVLVTCMIDGSTMGIDGDIIWSVWVNGDQVWASAPTPTRCDVPESEETTTTAVAPQAGGPPTTIADATTTTTTAVPPDVTDTTDVESPTDTTDTTVATLVSSVGPPTTTGTLTGSVTGPVTDTAVVTVAAQETLPVTGISLGALGGVGLTILGVGVALEGLARRKLDA